VSTKNAGIRVGSEKAMRALGERLGRLLEPGDFVGLSGELGAGKTVLVRGIAQGAGVPPGEVASPTFAIVYPYRGRIPIFHADLYRVADADELYATGFFDLLGAGGATLVEWIDRVPEAVPPEHLQIRIERTGARTRRIALEAAGERHEGLARALAAEALSGPRTRGPLEERPSAGRLGSGPRTRGPLEERPSAGRLGSGPRNRGPLEERPSAGRLGSGPRTRGPLGERPSAGRLGSGKPAVKTPPRGRKKR
jgi:tRNA threonylcarbamoyladenosine biosynthesis protein TsaE